MVADPGKKEVGGGDPADPFKTLDPPLGLVTVLAQYSLLRSGHFSVSHSWLFYRYNLSLASHLVFGPFNLVHPGRQTDLFHQSHAPPDSGRVASC